MTNFRNIRKVTATETDIIQVVEVEMDIDESGVFKYEEYVLDARDKENSAFVLRGLVDNWLSVPNNQITAYAGFLPTSQDVNMERDRRITSGFGFNGTVFDFDRNSKANIAGVNQLADRAIAEGAQSGDFRWHGGATDFTWIAQDNSTVAMDAQTVVAFGAAAFNHESSHILAARVLKNQSPIPADYLNDIHWP